jgi:hypothetical protein
MTEILLLFIWLLFFTMIVVATYKVHHLLKQYAAEDSDEKVEFRTGCTHLLYWHLSEVF